MLLPLASPLLARGAKELAAKLRETGRGRSSGFICSKSDTQTQRGHAPSEARPLDGDPNCSHIAGALKHALALTCQASHASHASTSSPYDRPDPCAWRNGLQRDADSTQVHRGHHDQPLPERPRRGWSEQPAHPGRGHRPPLQGVSPQRPMCRPECTPGPTPGAPRQRWAN